ncbi:MAG: PASTA domain-containing protein [Eggerthellaceae bacterium]|nr:PASTA domain-containing protein [Eggerthellaceae bacterium]
MRKTILLVTTIAVAVLMSVGVFALSGCSCSAQPSSSSASSAASSSSSAAEVEVPNLVFLEAQDAEKQIADAGLKLGDITEDYSDTVQSGLVISQDPEALKKVAAGAKVSITVSLGKKAPEEVTVPNLLGMTQTEAEQAIKDAKLVAVQDDPVVSMDVAPGLVCKQSIQAGATVDEGSQISFAIAMASDKVEVPEVMGQPYEGARDALQNLGLGCDKTTAHSDSFDKGIVISQSIDSGTEVDKGTVVTLKVSLGPKPAQKVEVPDVYTFTLGDAEDALESAGLKCRHTGEEDGTVIAMNPDAGTEVDPGTVVTIRLQHKTSTVEVPDIVGMTGNDALKTCQDLGLGLKYDESMGDQPLIDQSPDAGTMVDPGTVIEGTEPTPQPTTVTVPDIVGMTGDDALKACQDLGLGLKYDESRGNEKLSDQKPKAGTEVDPGTVIEGIFPKAPKPQQVTVPDLSGMSGKDAAAALDDLGLVLDYDEDDPDAKLSGTDPDAGTKADLGMTVKALYDDDDDDSDNDKS